LIYQSLIRLQINKCLTQSGTPSTWDGGLGMENDNSTLHNIVENVSGSVVCYDNIGADVNTRGGTNCNIKVYRPADKTAPILANKSEFFNKLYP